MTPCRRSTALPASLSLGGVLDLELMFFEPIEDFRLAREIRVLGCALVAVEMTRRTVTRLAAAVGLHAPMAADSHTAVRAAAHIWDAK